jgi:outer membrane protein
MRKKIIIGLCAAALLLLYVNVSFAQGPDKKWGIGARISYYAPDDTTIEGVKYDPDETALFEGNLTWLPINWLSLEFTVGYAKTDINAEALGVSLEFGEFKQVPLLLTGRLHWWSSDSKFTFYGGGGIGYYLNDFEVSSLFASGIPSLGVPGLSVDADDSFGFHLAVGLEYFVAQNWAFNLDLKYIWNEADITTTATGFSPEKDELDLDAFVFGIGIKYYF